jgi:predicted MFS family arabinose efflux permease
MNQSLSALLALNFFMADVRAGLGPFLGVFLQSRDWSPGAIGIVMTIGGLAAMVVTTPFGAFVDHTRAKRAVIAATAVVISIGSLITLLFPGFAAVAASQAVIGMAGAAVEPAIAAITLGLVHQRGYARQLGRNEAFNHAGNVVAAGAAGVFGYLFGLGAVFVVLIAMAALSIVSTSFIDPACIDHRAACGASEQHGESETGFGVLLRSKPLVVLGATLTLFHLGNAAMLPLLGQSLVAHGAGDPSAFTSATIVIAQITMVPMAIFAGRLADRKGYWIVFVLALIALPVRGVTAALVSGPWGLGPVQMLDGIGAGLLGVAVPGLVARILAGTGHVNAGLGAVMTLQAVGAAISPSLGGFVAGRLGYSAAFLTLGVVATAALVLWVAARPFLAKDCGAAPVETAAAV